MPANKYALLRYQIIDKMIGNKYNPFPTKEDLRNACEEQLYGEDSGRISDSTIEKDLWAMRNESLLGYNAPIRYSKLEKGYYYDPKNFTISKISLNDEEIEAIKLAVNTLDQFKEIDVFKDFQFAINKIADRINLTEDINDSSIRKFMEFDRVPQVDGTEHLSGLLEAIKKRRSITVTYKKFKDDAVERVYQLDPYLLKEFRHRWYLIAYDAEKEYFKTFGVGRIIAVEQTKTRYKINSYFDADRFFKNCYGITTIKDDDPNEIKLSVTPDQARYILSMPMHHSQKVVKRNDKEVVISIFVRVTWELIMDILAMGSNVKVISPAGVKNTVKKILKDSLNNY